ncbi:MAG TPA: hypothetical protein VLB80_00700 [Candidatus Babeliales bacterium]|nr:hypothetical protein [Candidatus Babeliales bacterium]
MNIVHCLKQQIKRLLLLALTCYCSYNIALYFEFRKATILPIEWFISFAIGYIVVGTFSEWYLNPLK